MNNLLLERIAYQEQRTAFGTWRRYMYPSGAVFAELRTQRTLLGWPLLHYTKGVCPETGRRVTARGVIAIGRLAVGIIALGQAAVGPIAIGQLALGLLLGLGQAATGFGAVGQAVLGAGYGLGQLAVGHVVVAQLGYGEYVLAQAGAGTHVWSVTRRDPQALAFFRSLPVHWPGSPHPQRSS
jgi:hypothetical protein